MPSLRVHRAAAILADDATGDPTQTYNGRGRERDQLAAALRRRLPAIVEVERAGIGGEFGPALDCHIVELEAALAAAYLERAGMKVNSTRAWCMRCGRAAVSTANGNDTCTPCAAVYA